MVSKNTSLGLKPPTPDSSLSLSRKRTRAARRIDPIATCNMIARIATKLFASFAEFA